MWLSLKCVLIWPQCRSSILLYICYILMIFANPPLPHLPPHTPLHTEIRAAITRRQHFSISTVPGSRHRLQFLSQEEEEPYLTCNSSNERTSHFEGVTVYKNLRTQLRPHSHLCYSSSSFFFLLLLLLPCVCMSTYTCVCVCVCAGSVCECDEVCGRTA